MAIKKGLETYTIDCALVVVTTQEEEPRSIALTTDTSVRVEPQVETTEAIKCMVKGVLKAQKPEKSTLTGHRLTFSDNATIMDLMPFLLGGTLEKDEQGNPTRYIPPEEGQDPPKCTVDLYSARMLGSDIIGYEKRSYPDCVGAPYTVSNQDDTFRVTEYTMNSAPGGGKRPYEIEYIDELPEIEEAATVIGTLTVKSVAGTTSGKTAVTVTPEKSGSNSYKYKTASSVTAPAYDEVCSSGYTAWDGTSEITATTGQKILIVEVDSANKAKKCGTATVASKA